MMFPSPRVIVIDDEPAHLNGLVRGLNRCGVASLPILFTEEMTQFRECPDVRVIFADLHLGLGSPSDHTTDFSTINSLLENNVKPAGPYFILLWTQYPDQAPALRTFLDQRLEGVKKPFDVVPLDKADHLDGNGDVRNEEKLVAAIDSVAGGLPQIGALFDWEGRVLKATGDTVSSLLELTSAEEAEQRPDKVRTVLAKLAIEAAGEKHVDHDRFRAVNEALLPILADRIADPRSTHGSNAVWERAFDTGDGARGLSADDAAKLNRLVHVADPGNAGGVADTGNAGGAERGVVIPLPERVDFRSVFDIEESDAAENQFRCREFVPDDDRFRWVLVQCQAACDHAQSQPGPLPFHLGLDFPAASEDRKRKPSVAVWTSPPFEFGGTVRLLRVSARFPISLPSAKVRNEHPVYRLREQLLNDLIHHLHAHGGRPGLISFRPR